MDRQLGLWDRRRSMVGAPPLLRCRKCGSIGAGWPGGIQVHLSAQPSAALHESKAGHTPRAAGRQGEQKIHSSVSGICKLDKRGRGDAQSKAVKEQDRPLVAAWQQLGQGEPANSLGPNCQLCILSGVESGATASNHGKIGEGCTTTRVHMMAHQLLLPAACSCCSCQSSSAGTARAARTAAAPPALLRRPRRPDAGLAGVPAASPAAAAAFGFLALLLPRRLATPPAAVRGVLLPAPLVRGRPGVLALGVRPGVPVRPVLVICCSGRGGIAAYVSKRWQRTDVSAAGGAPAGTFQASAAADSEGQPTIRDKSCQARLY